MTNASDLRESIERLMAQGRYEDAVTECGALRGDDCGDVFLLLLTGRAHHSAGRVEEARTLFELAEKKAHGDEHVLRSVEMFKRVTSVLSASRSDIENFIDPDAVLIQAPGWGVNTPPLGTTLLTSYARARGYKVLPLDLNVEFYLKRPPQFDNIWELEQSLWFWETDECVEAMLVAFKREMDAFVDMVVATRAPVVGFTIYNSSAYASIEVARMIKKRRPEIKIIFGGPHVSRDLIGKTVAGNPWIDGVAQGEGELVLLDIIDRVKAGRSLCDCPGLIVSANGQIVDNGDAGLLKDLDQLPAPDFADYAFELYRTPTRMPIMSSRGCPNRCAYCSERTYWKRFRSRSAESIFAEIQVQLTRYPFVNFFDFQDSLINGRIRDLEHLAELIIRNNLKISWAGQAVIRKEMTAELMRKLKRSGCVCLAYGLEAPSESLMMSIGKLLSKGADVNAIADAHGRTGLGVTYNFMFGLPGETEQDAFYVHEFLRRNKDSGMTVNPSTAFCYFFPGTPAHAKPQDYGIDFSKGLMYWESTDGRNTYLSRLKRFEDFCRLVKELGILTTYPSTVLLDRNRSLGKYFVAAGDPSRARLYFEAWLEQHPDDVDIRAALEALPPPQAIDSGNRTIADTSVNHTDENWLNGVARSWATAFLTENSIYARDLYRVGRQITFSDGGSRTILDAKNEGIVLLVSLDGSPLDGAVVGFPEEFTVQVPAAGFQGIEVIHAPPVA